MLVACKILFPQKVPDKIFNINTLMHITPLPNFLGVMQNFLGDFKPKGERKLSNLEQNGTNFYPASRAPSMMANFRALVTL